MTWQRAAVAAALTAVAASLAWLLFAALPQWYGEPSASVVEPAGRTSADEPARRITVRLFYVAADGRTLEGVEREVPYADTPTGQAKAIVTAQIADPPSPLVSAVPPGTLLRALFVTEQGEAFVDLSRDLTAAHPGGTLNELLTIYTLVNALTVNLPAITSVQLLVDGREQDTLAGHVDLGRPFVKNAAWVQ